MSDTDTLNDSDNDNSFVLDTFDNCIDYANQYNMDKIEEKYQARIKDIIDKVPVINFCNHFDHKSLYPKTLEVDQHAYIITHAQDRFPIIATNSLCPCVSFIAYEPALRVGCLTHIDGLPAYSKESLIDDEIELDYIPLEYNMKAIIDGMKIDANSETLNLDIYLIGGTSTLSPSVVIDIYDYINSYKNDKIILNLKGRNILGPDNQSRSVALDTRDGKLYYFDSYQTIYFKDETIDRQKKIYLLDLPSDYDEAKLFLSYSAHPLGSNSNGNNKKYKLKEDKY